MSAPSDQGRVFSQLLEEGKQTDLRNISLNTSSNVSKNGWVDRMELGKRWKVIHTYFSMERSPFAIAELDGLRALAILMVLARHGIRSRSWESHYMPVFPVSAWSQWDAATPFLNGWMGVDLFFVLSGFLIGYPLLKNLTETPLKSCINKTSGLPTIALAKAGPPHWLLSYFCKRFLRIAPAYYGLLILLGTGSIPFYHFSKNNWDIRFGYHFLFLQDYLPANIVVAFWSLGVEEKFYFFAPLLWVGLIRLKALKSKLMALGLLALLPSVFRTLTLLTDGAPMNYEHHFQAYRSPFHMSFEGFVLGSLCVLLYHFKKQLGWWGHTLVQNVLLLGSSLTIAVLLCNKLLLKEIHPIWLAVGPLVIAVAFSALLLGCCMGPCYWTTWLRSISLYFFSKISYSLYLVHMLFMEVSWQIVFLWFPHVQQTSLGQQFLFYFPIYLSVSVLAALLLHYALEKPFLVLKDRLFSLKS